MTIFNARCSHYHISMSHEVTGDMPVPVYKCTHCTALYSPHQSRSCDGALVPISGHQSLGSHGPLALESSVMNPCHLMSGLLPLSRIFYKYLF